MKSKALNKICLHWSAGAGFPNQHELDCYHFLVDELGVVSAGHYKPEDNINCYDGRYAAHTGGGNTGCIGVAVCGMFNSDHYITELQINRMCDKVAQLCLEYDIPISANTVFTHYEFGIKHPKSTSAGKIDLQYLPYNKTVANVGQHLRRKIKDSYKQIEEFING